MWPFGKKPDAESDDSVEQEEKVIKCTYCGGTQFYGGPEGGLSQNILCANPNCRHWFNHTVFGMDDLHKVEPTEEEKQTEKQKRQAERDEQDLALIAEGAKIYKDGHHIRDCIRRRQYTNVPWEDLLRVMGWTEAATALLEEKKLT